MSSSAPAWVSIAALGVSCLAALVALVSVRVSYLSFRASGPRLRLRIQSRQRDPGNGRVLIELRVVNEGRGNGDIASFHITPYGSSKAVLEIKDVMEGRALPYRLAGNSEETWFVDVVPVARKYDAGLRDRTFKPRSSWPGQIYFSVRGGNGEFVHAKSHRVDARQLIVDALPRPEDGLGNS